MTALDQKTIQTATHETARILREEKLSGKTRRAPDVAREVLLEITNLSWINPEYISLICSCLSKRRSTKNRSIAAKKGHLKKQSVIMQTMLEDAKVAEYRHQMILGDDY